MYICIAGKNKCAVEAVKYLLFEKIEKNKILILPNSNDNGKNGWQPSLKKFAKSKNIKIFQSALDAVQNSDCVMTDTWFSMGQKNCYTVWLVWFVDLGDI